MGEILNVGEDGEQKNISGHSESWEERYSEGRNL